MKKIILILIATIILGISGYIAIMYYASFSEGYRSGELIKISNKGMITPMKFSLDKPVTMSKTYNNAPNTNACTTTQPSTRK